MNDRILETKSTESAQSLYNSLDMKDFNKVKNSTTVPDAFEIAGKTYRDGGYGTTTSDGGKVLLST